MPNSNQISPSENRFTLDNGTFSALRRKFNFDISFETIVRIPVFVFRTFSPYIYNVNKDKRNV